LPGRFLVAALKEKRYEANILISGVFWYIDHQDICAACPWNSSMTVNGKIYYKTENTEYGNFPTRLSKLSNREEG